MDLQLHISSPAQNIFKVSVLGLDLGIHPIAQPYTAAILNLAPPSTYYLANTDSGTTAGTSGKQERKTAERKKSTKILWLLNLHSSCEKQGTERFVSTKWLLHLSSVSVLLLFLFNCRSYLLELLSCTGIAIPYSCETHNVCQWIHFSLSFWKWRGRKMSPLGRWCVLVFASLPLQLPLQNAQCEVCALRNDAAKISLENTSLYFLIKQKL